MGSYQIEDCYLFNEVTERGGVCQHGPSSTQQEEAAGVC